MGEESGERMRRVCSCGGREWGENEEGMQLQEMGNHEKVAAKRNRFGIWGRPLGLTPVSYI